jgi:peroxiredoxin
VLLAVSVDTAANTRKLLGKLEGVPGQAAITYLEDKDHQVIDRYGLFNPNSPIKVPHPATFVIDRRGVVRWRFVEVNYKVRPTNDDVRNAVRQIK